MFVEGFMFDSVLFVEGDYHVLFKFKHYYFVLWTICKHILCEIAYSGQ